MCLAVPARVLHVDEDDTLMRPAEVDFGGVRRTVSLALVPEAGPGDWVLVHVGFGIARIDAEQARRQHASLADALVGIDAGDVERPHGGDDGGPAA